MYRRIMHVFYGVALIGLAFIGQAQAVSLGKIDVASHLGEPFYAEVPLVLDKGEVVSNVFVELATPADYRILEVFRDDALNQIRADVKKDSRGTRVELSSDEVMEAPFFNIVLKVRYERATHFKKYPVFLDLPRAAKPAATAPVPTVSAVEAQRPAETVPVAPATMVVPEAMPAAEKGATPFKPYDGWARTGRYGPMVFGDTITTVAQRLRVDDRFTTQQVMVALFEKNSSKFDHDNINLIKAGTYLDVPTAAEVQRITPSQARSVLAKHEKQWKELTQQPRYAAVAEAQRTRYSKRIRVGEEASGVAAKPMEKAMPEEQEKKVSPVKAEPQASVAPTQAGKEPTQAEKAAKAAASKAAAEQEAALNALRSENETLKQQLADSEKKAAEMAKQASATQKVTTPDQAEAEARVKKLELKLARMQANLDRARQQVASGEAPLLNWLSYALIGAIVLMIALVGVLLMRGKRPHPAQQEFATEPAPAGFEPEFEEVKEIEVEEVPAVDENATVRMTADEFESAMENSIPDLTDEDTSEMEPFKEEEEEADPNVDYLSEADVYLRYGMEEEAEQQVKMALKLRHDSKDAHIKLAEIRKARGDQAGLDEAIGNARSALTGDALAAFEEAVAALGGAGGAAGTSSLEDTMPPIDETMIDHAAPAAPESEEGDLDFTSSGEFVFGEEEETPAAEVITSENEALDLGDIEWSTETSGGEGEETIVEEAPLEEAAAGEEEPAVVGADELDFDFSAFEAEGKTEEPEASLEEEPATAEAAGEGDLDFDFGEFELPESGAEAEAVAEAEVPAGGEAEAAAEEPAFDFGDLDLSEEFSAGAEESADEAKAEGADETLAMDWSSDTSSMTGAEASAEEETPSVEVSPLDMDIDLSGLDVDLSEEGGDEESFDDFSSTLQTNLAELSGQFEEEEKKGADTSAGEASDQGDELDFGELALEPIEEETFGDEAPAAASDTTDEDLDMDSIHDAMDRFRQQKADDDLDFEATMRLDTLLGEMSKDDDSSDDKGNS